MCCPEYGSCSKLKDLSDSDITKATSLADLAATKYVKVWPGLTHNTQIAGARQPKELGLPIQKPWSHSDFSFLLHLLRLHLQAVAILPLEWWSFCFFDHSDPLNPWTTAETFQWVCFCLCSVAQLCLTLCDPMDCSLPGYSVHGIFLQFL